MLACREGSESKVVKYFNVRVGVVVRGLLPVQLLCETQDELRLLRQDGKVKLL